MLDIAILEGVRTPFAKAYGPLASVSAQELGRIATTAVLERAALPARSGRSSRLRQRRHAARCRQHCPRHRPASPASRVIASLIACSAIAPPAWKRLTTAAQLIQLGEAPPVVAGGVESMSRIPLALQSRGHGALFATRQGEKLATAAGDAVEFSAAALQAGHGRAAGSDRPGVRPHHGRYGGEPGPRLQPHAGRSKTPSPWRAIGARPRHRNAACWPRRSCRFLPRPPAAPSRRTRRRARTRRWRRWRG